MSADMTDPKNWGIAAVMYLFFMLVLWKFQFGETKLDLWKIKLVISIVFAPICYFIVYKMAED